MENNEQKSFLRKVLTSWKTWAAVFLLVIVISVFDDGTSSSKTSEPVKNNTDVTQTETKPKVDPIKVTADSLLKAYEANEISADAQFKGKTVEITGTIDTIGKDILNDPYVALDTQNSIFNVQCMFDKSNSEKLVNLSKGTKITLTGVVSGKMWNIIVRQCNF